RRAAHAVDEGQYLIAPLVWQVLDDGAGQDLGDLVRRLQLGPFPSGLAMDADAQLHLVVGDLERHFARRRHDAGGQRHAHAAAVRVDFLRQRRYRVEVRTGLSRAADDLLQQDRDTHATASGRVEAVLDGHVVVGADG